MVRIETPIETPTSAKTDQARLGPRVGAPPAPPSAIDRVPFRADAAKKTSRFPSAPSPLKAFPAPPVRHSYLFYDRLISQFIAELSRG